jgi:hypothetical protein
LKGLHAKLTLHYCGDFDNRVVAWSILLERFGIDPHTDRTGSDFSFTGYYQESLDSYLSHIHGPFYQQGYSLHCGLFCWNKRERYQAERLKSLSVLEQSRQIFAHLWNSSPYCDSQISAHSSQIPTQSSAILFMFTEPAFRAWKVPIQINAHSSTTLSTLAEKRFL